MRPGRLYVTNGNNGGEAVQDHWSAKPGPAGATKEPPAVAVCLSLSRESWHKTLPNAAYLSSHVAQ